MCVGGGESGVCNLRKLIEGYGILFCKIGGGLSVKSYCLYNFQILYFLSLLVK